ncbi:MAG: hypothetical protein KBD26_02020 [Candidatus Pacebacteria bacterium]|nr:hypothetical protein [Candidatus Paceibacterota bacterium]
MDKEPIQNKIENTESVDMEKFGDNIKNASPSTLLKIKEVMKRPETWFGIATVAAGALVGNQVFNHSETVNENLDSLGNGVEDFRDILNAYKVLAGSIISSGVLMTLMGINKGNNLAKQKANQEE